MKRNNDSQTASTSSSKKLKFEDCDNLDDLWGPDPDIQDIDDCLLRATQVVENELNIVGAKPTASCSFIPSTYTGFGKDNDIFSSTVVNFEFKEPQARENGDKLQRDLLAKEGEITILRSQLKHTRDTLEAEGRKFAEFEEKLNVSKKEMSVVATELEFKKLEIANLKRKLLDISKVTNQNPETTLNGTHIVKEKINSVPQQETKPKTDFILQPVVSDIYPLRDLISPVIFNVGPKERGCCGLGRIKEENLLSQRSLPQESPKQMKLCDDVPLKLEFIFPEISALINSNRSQLNEKSNERNFNKILLVSLQFLHNLCEYLREFEKSVVTDAIRQSDLEYLMDKSDSFDAEVSLFDTRQLFGDECGIQCRQTVAIVAALVPHSRYTRNFITGQSNLKVNEDETYVSHLTCFSQFDECQFLITILNIIEILGRTRKSSNYTGLLCSVCALLSGICGSVGDFPSERCLNLVFGISREIILCRPRLPVLHYLSEVLKNASLHKGFVQRLCRMPQKNGIKKNNKKGIVLINQDCCPFQVFSLLYKDTLSQAHDSTGTICQRNYNILQFLSNAFTSNCSWLYYREGKHYDCLFECNELTIEIIYTTLIHLETKKFTAENHKCLLGILRMSVKILYTLNFKSYEFIERNIRIYSQYKVIVKKLLELKDLINFRQQDVDYLVKLGSTGQDEGAFVGSQSLETHFIWSK